MIEPLPVILIEPIVRAALMEDLGRAGDITTDAVIPTSARFDGVIAARKPGTIAGIEAARLAFFLLDPTINLGIEKPDGTAVAAGDIVARVRGPARAVLSAERTALNFLSRLSGTATATARLVEAAKPHRARIVCTRKTTPGLRILEKHAVRAGGGVNHRFGLDDAVLIKDNHVAVAGGVRPAVERARAAIGHLVKIEVEVDTLQQLEEVLTLPVDVVLLDNMAPAVLARAVDMVNGKLLTEASGQVNEKTVRDIAATGVDYISSGWITHSAPILDLGLDV
jgi:nicotinate-nucleotide pyrophosphorylase (carboxylating)